MTMETALNHQKLSVSVDSIPCELKGVPQWVCWQLETRDGKHTKVPINPLTLGYASCSDRQTWASFANAFECYERHGTSGIGFVFTSDDPYIGVDLDKCRDPETGAIEPWALTIIDALSSYTEISPSGCGVHVYLKGTLPAGKRRKGKIEMYETGRFFTLTGEHLTDTPATIEHRTGELAALHTSCVADPVSPPVQILRREQTRSSFLSDEEILSKCRTARNSEKFIALWDGDWSRYPSPSDADLALLGILRFYTQDAGRLDRLFRQSGLMRDKWDELRGEQTYGARTISQALSHVTDTYHGQEASNGTMSGLSGSHPEEWPDISPVKAELLPVEPLSLNIVPASLRGWIQDVANRMQCPPDFVATAMLVMAGSIIGAGCGIRPKEHDDWTVVPNLWGGVVGRPSMLKTPAISEGLKPLEGLELAAKQDYDAAIKAHSAEMEAHKARREALQREMRQVAKGKISPNGHTPPTMDRLKHDFTHLNEPHPPIWRRYKTNDATIEKMGELLADNPRGLLLFRDELTGLFFTWDKEGHESDRAFYLEAFNGTGSYTYDRIGRGSIYVENLCVSLFGGIQPEKLSAYLHAAMRGRNNDGLVQRLQVMVYPDEPHTWTLVDVPIDTSAKQQAYRVVQGLASMDFRHYGALGDEGQRIPYFRFDKAAQAVFYEWLRELETTKLRQTQDEPVIVEHLAKYRSLMPSLALIFHGLTLASEDSPVPSQVSKECATQAAAWCDYLESHARRIYGLVTNVTAQAAARLARKLREGALPTVFTVRDVYRKEWSLLNDSDVVENACDELESLGWLRKRVTPTAPGQRGKTEYVTNPKVRG